MVQYCPVLYLVRRYSQKSEINTFPSWRALDITLCAYHHAWPSIPLTSLVSQWSPDLGTSWNQNSRTWNQRNVEHIVASSIYSSKSHPPRQVCKSRTSRVRLKSFIIQGCMCSTEQQIRKSGDESRQSGICNDTPLRYIENKVQQEHCRSQGLRQIPGPNQHHDIEI